MFLRVELKIGTYVTKVLREGGGQKCRDKSVHNLGTAPWEREERNIILIFACIDPKDAGDLAKTKRVERIRFKCSLALKTLNLHSKITKFVNY